MNTADPGLSERGFCGIARIGGVRAGARFVVRPAAAPIAVRWAARRCAVQPATRQSAVRTAAAAAWGHGGAVYRPPAGGVYYGGAAAGHTIRCRGRDGRGRRRGCRRRGGVGLQAARLLRAAGRGRSASLRLLSLSPLLLGSLRDDGAGHREMMGATGDLNGVVSCGTTILTGAGVGRDSTRLRTWGGIVCMDLVPDAGQLSQLMVQATAPAFVLGAVAAFISVLLGRMANVLDRIRSLNEISDDTPRSHLKSDIPRLRRRTKLLNSATHLALVSGLCTSLLLVLGWLSSLRHEYCRPSFALAVSRWEVTLRVCPGGEDGAERG